MEQRRDFLIGLAEKYMLFKGSNNIVQIYRSFAITGNYGRWSFSKYGICHRSYIIAANVAPL
jgi:hypothetical protein